MNQASLRLFVAASVPEEQLVWVAERVAEARERWPEARWIPPENQHVTLKFLGSTPEERAADVGAACERVAQAHRPAPLGLSRLGVFPAPQRARVLWVGLDDPNQLLPSLAAGLDDALAPLGFQPEKRPYSGHLTIARFRSPTAVGALPPAPPTPAPFELRGFGLWRSHLSPKGARYERLMTFPLR